MATVSEFRSRTELASFFLNRDAFEASQVEYQTSAGGAAELPRRRGEKQADVSKAAKIVKFVSAHTAGKLEDRFAGGLSWLSKIRTRMRGKTEESYETIRYNDRARLTTRVLDRLNMGNPKLMGAAIEDMAMVLGRGDERKTQEIQSVAQAALTEVRQARENYYDTENPDYGVSNMLLVLTVLEKYTVPEEIQKKAEEGKLTKEEADIYGRMKNEFEEMVRGLKYLTIAGKIDQTRNFKKACVRGAWEIGSVI